MTTSRAILDDHLLRDLLAGATPDALAGVLADHEPATTNYYLYRLCKSVVSASGGSLTGSWAPEQRRALGARLVDVPTDVQITPIRSLAYRMAEIADEFRVSTLGAEAVAASELDGALLCVWAGDDGPGTRDAMRSLGLDYLTIER